MVIYSVCICKYLFYFLFKGKYIIILETSGIPDWHNAHFMSDYLMLTIYSITYRSITKALLQFFIIIQCDRSTRTLLIVYLCVSVLSLLHILPLDAIGSLRNN